MEASLLKAAFLVAVLGTFALLSYPPAKLLSKLHKAKASNKKIA